MTAKNQAIKSNIAAESNPEGAPAGGISALTQGRALAKPKDNWLQKLPVFLPPSRKKGRRKERRIKVVVVVVGGVEIVENRKIPQKPFQDGLFGTFPDSPKRKTTPETD